MCEIVDTVVSALDSSHCFLAIHHLLSGDACATNPAASRRVFGFLRTRAGFTYRILIWVYATHQANLVVQVAICGRLVQNASTNNELCATCVRLFKYLTVSYSEEFAASLRAHITQHATNISTALRPDVQRARDASLKLVELYGKDCLPDDVMEALNAGFGGLVNAAAESTSIEAVRRKFCDTMYKHMIVIEEHPVPTRFFTFAQCVWVLCRVMLLCLPISIYSVTTINPQQVMGKRLKAIKNYWSKDSTPAELRVTSVCLRLSAFVMNMIAKKPKREDPASSSHGSSRSGLVAHGAAVSALCKTSWCRLHVLFFLAVPAPTFARCSWAVPAPTVAHCGLHVVLGLFQCRGQGHAHCRGTGAKH